ncbi:tRNA pseudouridine(55) synthase TruB [Candidatus Dojkabacteria bacterium]|nr:tRNA pseudouridine(55) synthase TruB [Candidatus Dojkabacteria bacterium]
MIDGILIIDKESGITSYDVIRKLKRIFDKGQKIGHAGTLDPFATGLFIILLGKATKMMNTFHTYEKTYLVEGELGYCTDTQDREGKVIKKDETKITPSRDEIETIIEENFMGDITQIPPSYSAKKVEGKKAYDLAREGKELTLKPVNISISQFEVYEYEYPMLKCKIKCSTGTYIRTLIHDLGIKLGTYATTKELRRITIGSFDVSEAVLSKDICIENKENILRRVIKI